MIVNGAIIECAGDGARLRISEESTVLRQREILLETDAVTPASRVYFALQCAYVFSGSRAEHLARAKRFLEQYAGACRSAALIVEQIHAGIAEGRLDRSLRHTRDLLRHENLVLNAFAARLQEEDVST